MILVIDYLIMLVVFTVHRKIKSRTIATLPVQIKSNDIISSYVGPCKVYGGMKIYSTFRRNRFKTKAGSKLDRF